MNIIYENKSIQTNTNPLKTFCRIHFSNNEKKHEKFFTQHLRGRVSIKKLYIMNIGKKSTTSCDFIARKRNKTETTT